MNISLKSKKAFTIVELLVVIVVIGILAAITIVSYSGIRLRAVSAAIKSQLSDDTKLLKMYYVDNGLYPSSLDTNNCPNVPVFDANKCLKNFKNSTLSYSGTSNTFELKIIDNETSIGYSVTQDDIIAEVNGSLASVSYISNWGGVNYDSMRASTKMMDGGNVLVGQTYSFGSGADDAVILKLDSSGALLWSKTLGGTGSDYANAVDATSDGGFVVAGYTESYGGGYSDAYLSKFDSAGSLQWSRTWGGANNDEAQDVAETSDGGYVITGSTYSYGPANGSSFLAKFSVDGTFQWNKNWGGANGDLTQSIAKTTDGGCVLSGYTTSYGSGDNDAAIYKFDSSGNLSWTKTWGGVGFDQSTDIIQTSDSGYAITGYTDNYGAGDYDAFLVKFDSSGILSWSKTWGGTGWDTANSLIQTSDSGYAIIGYEDSYGAGHTDSFLAKFDASGILSWSKTWGGIGYENAYDVIQSSDNGYVVVGESNSYGVGDYEMFASKYKNDGDIANCSSPKCQSPVATTTAPSVPTSSPSQIPSSPVATKTSPSMLVIPITPTKTVVAEP